MSLSNQICTFFFHKDKMLMIKDEAYRHRTCLAIKKQPLKSWPSLAYFKAASLTSKLEELCFLEQLPEVEGITLLGFDINLHFTWF